MKILLVDDETLARDRLRRLLEDEPQHEVVGEAANGMEAVKRCEELQPDLVLLDIRMPGMDGLETARHFLELESPPGVIFCTAYDLAVVRLVSPSCVRALKHYDVIIFVAKIRCCFSQPFAAFVTKRPTFSTKSLTKFDKFRAQ